MQSVRALLKLSRGMPSGQSPSRAPVCVLKALLGPLVLCLGLLTVAMPGNAQDLAPALQHGINLSNWFTDFQRQPLVERDFRQIKATGFDHVRLPVDPELLGFSLGEGSTGRVLFDFSKLDAAIELARSSGLSIILDIQPSDGFLSFMELDPKAERGFVALWGHIAEHYKSMGTNTLVFELLNAPRYNNDKARYKTLVADAVSAIHQIIPKSVIIVDAPKGATLDGFDGLTAINDENVIYAFQFFEPFLFTRQGLKASGYGQTVRYFRNLPYPSSEADPKFVYAPNAADAIEARKSLQDYIAANWDASHIASRIKFAADWGKANHRRVMCSAFGVTRNLVPVAARYQWIADTRKSLEANEMGWDLWDYTDLFGIAKLGGSTVPDSDGALRLTDLEGGTRDIEPDAVKALFTN
jgi:endoglucanase